MRKTLQNFLQKVSKMKNTYKVIDSFDVKDSKVLVLDNKWGNNIAGTRNIAVGNKQYNYGLTHNENWIIVKTTDNLVGKSIIFQ